MHQTKILRAGKNLAEADKALVMIHGRGGNAEDILSLSSHLNVADYALLAPEATNYTWYPQSFLVNPDLNEPWLSSALSVLLTLEDEIKDNGINEENLFFLGFSQGACLTLEYVARNAKQYGGVVAFTGGLIGDQLYKDHYGGNFSGSPIFIGTSDPDPHVPVARVHETVELLKTMNANVLKKVYDNMGHTISQDEIDKANEHVFSA